MKRSFLRHCTLPVILTVLFSTILSLPLTAQSWNFIKEKDGIKLYTKEEPGVHLKSFRGIVDIDAPAEKVFDLLENVNNTSWWDKNITRIRILHYEKNKSAQYYLVYDLPWPVADRDLCVDVKISLDTMSGERRITAGPLPGLIPEVKGMVRIKNYNQSWTVTPRGRDMTHVILEGFVDPGGSIPDWILNMLIIDSPFRSLKGIIDQLGRKG